MKQKRYVTIHRKMSEETLKKVLVDEFGADTGKSLFENIQGWFTVNPKKTCCHIKNLRMKIRKWTRSTGVYYTIEEA